MKRGAKAEKIKRPKLLFLLNEALFFTTHRMPVALAAKAAGCEVHVAAPYDAAPVELIRANGFRYHDLPLKRGGRNPLAELRLLWAFFSLIRQVRPHLVHHVAMKPVIFGGIASRLLRVPAAVFAITGLGFLFVRDDWQARLIRRLIMPLYRFALGHRNGITIFQNPDDRALFFHHNLVRLDRDALIRGCGVDMAEFRPGPKAPGAPIVMFPARIIGDKGVHEFIAAVRHLKKAGSEARFVLVGRRDPDNPTDVPEETVRGWEAEGLVEWWGYRQDMAEVLPQATVICMPSYREGLPRGLIEAAASGVAIVTTDVAGCREVVDHRLSGLLVPLKNAEATADAIAQLLADPRNCANFAHQARLKAEREFSVEQFVADSLDIYATVVPGGPFARKRKTQLVH